MSAPRVLRTRSSCAPTSASIARGRQQVARRPVPANGGHDLDWSVFASHQSCHRDSPRFTGIRLPFGRLTAPDLGGPPPGPNGTRRSCSSFAPAPGVARRRPDSVTENRAPTRVGTSKARRRQPEVQFRHESTRRSPLTQANSRWLEKRPGQTPPRGDIDWSLIFTKHRTGTRQPG